jgi:hypothetical protein
LCSSKIGIESAVPVMAVQNPRFAGIAPVEMVGVVVLAPSMNR